MLVFIKSVGVFCVAAGLGAWWIMIEGLLAGKIEFATKGSVGEIWYSRIDSPNAFWSVIAFYLFFGITFLVISYFVLRKDNPRVD